MNMVDFPNDLDEIRELMEEKIVGLRKVHSSDPQSPHDSQEPIFAKGYEGLLTHYSRTVYEKNRAYLEKDPLFAWCLNGLILGVKTGLIRRFEQRETETRAGSDK